MAHPQVAQLHPVLGGHLEGLGQGQGAAVEGLSAEAAVAGGEALDGEELRLAGEGAGLGVGLLERVV